MTINKTEEEIHRLLLQNKQTLSLAESCTGGALAVCFTRLPGCSSYFLGSVVAYSNLLKMRILGLDSLILEKGGAVSREAVIGMAEGIRKLSHSSYGIAVSGVAGPGGGTLETPVGTIWIAISSNKETLAWSVHLVGDRQKIIDDVVQHILLEFLKLIKNE